MGHRPFSKPIRLILPRGESFTAFSPYDALEYLEHHWPGEHTAFSSRARAICIEAVDGFVDSEIARRVMLDAAQRARLLVHKKRSAGTTPLWRVAGGAA